MSIVVFSDDLFFARGVRALLARNCQREEKICVIDIESFSSLHDIKYRILNELTAPYSIVFIRGHGILSMVLSLLESISRNAPVTEFKRHIKEVRRYTVDHTLAVLTFYRELRNLTHREISTACALRRYKSVPVISQRIHCSTKGAYQRVSTIAQKMNLKYGTQIQYFLHSEYTQEELQQMDDMHQAIVRSGGKHGMNADGFDCPAALLHR